MQWKLLYDYVAGLQGSKPANDSIIGGYVSKTSKDLANTNGHCHSYALWADNLVYFVNINEVKKLYDKDPTAFQSGDGTIKNIEITHALCQGYLNGKTGVHGLADIYPP
jgi:hypothetical protein